jgi:hypothetical protein
LEEFEITRIVKDTNGIISHCYVKGYGIQPIAVIEKLIEEGVCSFFMYDRKNKLYIYARTSSNGTTFLTTDSCGFKMDKLSLLPLCDRPFLSQLIESVR